MNRALNIKNWNKGGNSYVLKGNPKNKWVGFRETVIDQLRLKFTNFNIVIWTDKNEPDDYYSIPFSSLAHLFTDEHKTTGKYKNRWTAIILDHKFQMHSNQNFAVDVSEFYGAEIIKQNPIIVDEDYFIENAKAEINIRIGQSKFRKAVLKNCNYKCALTGIEENTLLVASHIIPWSHNKNIRGDFKNGIALYFEFDKFFDKGYISFSDEYKIIISPVVEKLSEKIKSRIFNLENLYLKNLKKDISLEFLKYHRENILKK